jgi:hypothetical protein
LLIGCEGPYGKLGGADITTSYESLHDIEGIIDRFSGVWYSHYGTRKLDSYRVSRWSDRHSIMPPDKQYPVTGTSEGFARAKEFSFKENFTLLAPATFRNNVWTEASLTFQHNSTRSTAQYRAVATTMF